MNVGLGCVNVGFGCLDVGFGCRSVRFGLGGGEVEGGVDGTVV
ncbi:hypothetical protein JOM49_004000 [Amycolatopsis magusensis]|uniref:Uncharacterized protein n=1 Tax=Amycolatopsis magusensis TaxID=882444 RepID=A0ABS4PSS6_9PSEU|nr:hypothetical protein [Amycolatopsis magusensis]